MRCIKEGQYCLALCGDNIAEVNKHILQNKLGSLSVSLLDSEMESLLR